MNGFNRLELMRSRKKERTISVPFLIRSNQCNQFLRIAFAIVCNCMLEVPSYIAPIFASR